MPSESIAKSAYALAMLYYTIHDIEKVGGPRAPVPFKLKREIVPRSLGINKYTKPAAMPAVKWSAGVAPEVNLQECTLHSPLQRSK